MAERELQVKITANADGLNRALTETANKLSNWSRNSMGGFTELGESLGLIAIRFAAMTAPITGTGAAIIALASKTSDAAIEISNMSKEVGLSINTLQRLKYAAQLSNIDFNSLGVSFGILSKNIIEASSGIGAASDTFAALGIKVKDSNGNIKSTDEILSQLSGKFSNMKDSAGKTALILELFGRSGKDMIRVFEEFQSTGGLDKVFTEDNIAAAKKYDDNIKNMKINFDNLAHSIGNKLIPVLNTYYDYFTKDLPVERMKSQLDVLEKNIAIDEADLKTKEAGGFWSFLLPDINLIRKNLSEAKAERDKLYAQFTHEPTEPAAPKTTAPIAVDTATLKRFEVELTAFKASELNKRLADVDKFIASEMELLKKSKVGKAKFTEKETELLAAAEDKKARIIEDHQRQIREAAIKHEITLLEIAEQERKITKQESLEKRIALYKELENIYTAILGKVDRMNDPAGWQAASNSLDEITKKAQEFNKALKETTGTFSEGIKEGLYQFADSVGSTFQQVGDMAKQTAQAMQQAFSDFFFDLFTGKLKTAEEYVKSFANSILKTISDMIAQLIVKYIALYVVQVITGLTAQGKYDTAINNTQRRHQGGLVMHEGGIVPRFHFGGLASDERPAILQTGEGVLSRRGMSALGNLNSGNVSQPQVNLAINVENKSSQPVNAKQGDMKFDGKQYVVGIILEDINGYGPLRHAIAGVR